MQPTTTIASIPYHALPRNYGRVRQAIPDTRSKMMRPGLLRTLRDLVCKGLVARAKWRYPVGKPRVRGGAAYAKARGTVP
jgi:hypothetical protein